MLVDIVENSWLIAANCQILQGGCPKVVGFQAQFGCLQKVGRSQACGWLHEVVGLQSVSRLLAQGWLHLRLGLLGLADG